jgi:hypothetical protein
MMIREVIMSERINALLRQHQFIVWAGDIEQTEAFQGNLMIR